MVTLFVVHTICLMSAIFHSKVGRLMVTSVVIHTMCAVGQWLFSIQNSACRVNYNIIHRHRLVFSISNWHKHWYQLLSLQLSSIIPVCICSPFKMMTAQWHGCYPNKLQVSINSLKAGHDIIQSTACRMIDNTSSSVQFASSGTARRCKSWMISIELFWSPRPAIPLV